MHSLLASIGSTSLQVASDVGGMTLVALRVIRGLLPPRIDGGELLRALRAYGEASIPVVAATAGFTGMIIVLQAGVHISDVGADDMVGWFSGYATFREVGPMLIGLIFSGRVGASNTSELATMRVTEQLDALRILAIDVYDALVLPRCVAMVIALGALVIIGDWVAILAGALVARLLLGVDFSLYFNSLWSGLTSADLFIGIEKALAYGFVVAVVSTHFGLSAKQGSAGVGRAVNAQVVGCAVGIYLTDWLITVVGR